MTGILAITAAAWLAQAPAPDFRAAHIAKLEARVAAGDAQCVDLQQLARLYRDRGDFDLGLTTVRRCLVLAPESAASYLAVATYLSDEANALRTHAMTLQRGAAPQGGFESPGCQGAGFAAAAAAGAPPVRVGGNIRPPVKRKHVNPVYPEEARQARASGVVIIEATLGADGRVAGACVLRSIPMFDAAALDAVRQWEFEPTLLNGEPVPVIMTVTVNFTLM